MTEVNVLFPGFGYIEEKAKAEGIRPDEFIQKYGVSAVYRDYYPDGYSACVADQECRGNKDATNACLMLMRGDPSHIKREKGMAKGALWMGKCDTIFKSTRLGKAMEATAISGSVLANVVLDEDPYRDTGGVGSTTPETSTLQEGVTYVGKAVKEIKLPTFKMPSFGWELKGITMVVVLFVAGIVGLMALGYSGLGGSVGRVGEREHKKHR